MILIQENNTYHFKGSKLHREDGPALITERFEKWYLNGELHRVDGPAIEYLNEDDKHLNKWYQNGKLHREDGPAKFDNEFYLGVGETTIVNYYYQNGKLHREGGPAIERRFGENEWYLDGKRHREDGPAIETYGGFNDGWYLNGELHREDGPAQIRTDSLRWYKNGKLHREDGPAWVYWKNNDKLAIKTHRSIVDNAIKNIYVETTIYKEWYQNGELHREDGPAYISNSESTTKPIRWYFNGIEINPDHIRILANGEKCVYVNHELVNPSFLKSNTRFFKNKLNQLISKLK